jgi:hypothetical protein
MTDTGIFMIGVIVMAITLAGTVASVMSGSVADDPTDTSRTRSERGS